MITNEELQRISILAIHNKDYEGQLDPPVLARFYRECWDLTYKLVMAYEQQGKDIDRLKDAYEAILNGFYDYAPGHVHSDELPSIKEILEAKDG